MEVPEPLLVGFGPVVLLEVLGDIEFVWFELVEHREWVIGADAQLEKFLVHLDSFPVCFVEEPVGECDDGIPEIFVVTRVPWSDNAVQKEGRHQGELGEVVDTECNQADESCCEDEGECND